MPEKNNDDIRIVPIEDEEEDFFYDEEDEEEYGGLPDIDW